jgi:hypothetical protein
VFIFNVKRESLKLTSCSFTESLLFYHQFERRVKFHMKSVASLQSLLLVFAWNANEGTLLLHLAYVKPMISFRHVQEVDLSERKAYEMDDRIQSNMFFFYVAIL